MIFQANNTELTNSQNLLIIKICPIVHSLVLDNLGQSKSNATAIELTVIEILKKPLNIIQWFFY